MRWWSWWCWRLGVVVCVLGGLDPGVLGQEGVVLEGEDGQFFYAVGPVFDYENYYSPRGGPSQYGKYSSPRLVTWPTDERVAVSGEGFEELFGSGGVYDFGNGAKEAGLELGDGIVIFAPDKDMVFARGTEEQMVAVSAFWFEAARFYKDLRIQVSLWGVSNAVMEDLDPRKLLPDLDDFLALPHSEREFLQTQTMVSRFDQRTRINVRWKGPNRGEPGAGEGHHSGALFSRYEIDPKLRSDGRRIDLNFVHLLKGQAKDSAAVAKLELAVKRSIGIGETEVIAAHPWPEREGWRIFVIVRGEMRDAGIDLYGGLARSWMERGGEFKLIPADDSVSENR
ncbi:MAG: hypothetical protein AAF591_21230 [Verrucomicrobiota bacterium]